MFVSKNQFYIFVACFVFGAVCGIIFSLTGIFRRIVKNKFVYFITDLIFVSAFSVLFSIYSYEMNFSNLRAYMLLSVLLGFIAYLKSFNIILANLVKKFYNIIRPKIKRQKGKRYDRRKGKKSYSGNDGRGSAPSSDFARIDVVSNDFN